MWDLPELGQSQLGSPDLLLASKTVGSDESQSKRNAHKLASDKNNAPTSGVSERGSSTYSLISFSFSKGLLGVSKVLESIRVRGR